MNLLINPLPDKTKYGYNVRTDFRYWINFARILDDDSLDDITKVELALKSVYVKDTNFNDTENLINGALDFYRMGEPIDEKPKHNSKILDFDKDAQHIIVSFQQQYGIRLLSERLHWWEFKILLNGLNADTIMGSIMQIRASKITSDMSKAEKQHLMKMKRLYSLQDIKDAPKLTEEDFIKQIKSQETQMRKSAVAN